MSSKRSLKQQQITGIALIKIKYYTTASIMWFEMQVRKGRRNQPTERERTESKRAREEQKTQRKRDQKSVTFSTPPQFPVSLSNTSFTYTGHLDFWAYDAHYNNGSGYCHFYFSGFYLFFLKYLTFLFFINLNNKLNISLYYEFNCYALTV